MFVHRPIAEPEKVQIREVWAYNLEEEFARIRELVERYPYISMDTEFPGVAARPVGRFKSASDYAFQTLRCNVDMLKIIQLGITFCDAEGQLPPGCPTWQFNFKFDLEADMYAGDSIKLLERSGILFSRLRADGVDPEAFGELIMSSGLVLNDDISWVSFHSSFDFGYLLKLLTCLPLPRTEEEFFDLLTLYFPSLYDIKYICAVDRPTLIGGLNKLGDDLGVARIGPMHQAGSDSLLTASVFFKLQEVMGGRVDSKFRGKLYGLGDSPRV